MDPNETLRLAREAARRFSNAVAATERNYPIILERAFELRDAFDALDEWMSRGGFAPSSWMQSVSATVAAKLSERS